MDDPLYIAHQRAVPAVWVLVQFLDPWHNTCAHGVEVNIADKLLQVGVFLTDNGFVTILKKLATAFVAAIKADGVSRENPSHYRGKGGESGSKEEMGVLCEVPDYVKATSAFLLIV